MALAKEEGPEENQALSGVLTFAPVIKPLADPTAEERARQQKLLNEELLKMRQQSRQKQEEMQQEQMQQQRHAEKATKELEHSVLPSPPPHILTGPEAIAMALASQRKSDAKEKAERDRFK